ncbi:MAG TPA: hypothetical protein PLA03_11390 [Acidobacteriota bacterium]|nr:hypothetical protein [Acidobacteriota bacterium]
MRIETTGQDLRKVIWRLAFLGVALWGIVYYLRLFDQKLLLGDEGVALMNAWRIALGEIPHRDFFSFIPPASFLPTTALFKLFGPSLLVSRLIAFALAVLLCFSTDLVLRELSAARPVRFMSLALLIPFGISYWPIPSHHWWCDIWCLAAAISLLRSAESGSPGRWAFAGGSSAALAALSLQDQGGYFLLLASVLFLPSVQAVKRKVIVVFSAGGVLSVFALFAAWILPSADAGRLFSDLVIFPITSYHNIEGHQGDILSGWNQILPILSPSFFFKAPFYLASLAAITILFMALPVLSASALCAGTLKNKQPRHHVALAAALAISFFGAALHRWSFTNIVWAFPGLVIPLALFPSSGRTGKALRLVASFFAVAALVFSFSFYHLSGDERLVTVRTSVGSLRTFKTNDTRDLIALLDYLEPRKKDGDTLFCGGFKGLINIFALAKNSTPFNDFPGYNTPEHLASLEKCLRSGEVTWVCLPKSGGKPDEKLAAIVREGYLLEFENSQYILYRLK